MCVFVIPAASVVVICLFQGCLTLWIIRTAARRRWWSRPKVRWRRGDAAAREVMPANRYRSLILSLLHPFSVTPTTTVACCSAHVISVAGARGWPPLPPPYGHTLCRHRDFDVRIRHRRAHTVDARVRDVAANTAAFTLQPRPTPLSYDAPLRHL